MLNSSLSATRSHSLPSTPTLSPLSSTSFPSLSSPSPSSVSCLLPSSSSFSKKLTSLSSLSVSQLAPPNDPRKQRSLKVKCSQREPLKVMISGAPASGKGTQCEMISQKFGLVHISTGDLLRAEVSAGTDIGNKAKEYMNSGRLVPDEIVTSMVTARLSLKDAKEKGWLLDGYPRSLAQAKSLEKLKIRPDVYIMLDVQRILLFASIVLDLLRKDDLFIQVPDEILIDRCVGRRLDPLTGRIYHEKNFPPETEEIKARLVTRPDC